MQPRRHLILFAAVALAVWWLPVTVAEAAPASPARYPCSYGTPGSAPLVDSNPARRPFAPGTESMPNVERAQHTLITNDAAASRSFCSCTFSRSVTDGLHPAAAEAYRRAVSTKSQWAIDAALAEGRDWRSIDPRQMAVWVRTAFRPWDEQVCLYTRYGPNWAAKPGRSPHGMGIAIDIEDWGDQWGGVDQRALEQAGWCRTVRSEPWHYEYGPLLDQFGRGGRCLPVK